jgi:hypothetical protein
MEEHYPEILRRFMGEERDGSFEYYDKTTKDAADICGASQGTSSAAKGTEPVNRQERAQYSEQVRPLEEAALKQWALHERLWIAEKDFLSRYAIRKIGSGAEQKVYLKEDGLTVVKVNKGRFHGNWLEYFNRLLFHAFLFPATKYTTVGFTEDEGSFAVITEQQFALLNQGASREVVETYLNNHGFIRLKNDDYFNRAISVKLEDLHDENVFLDEEGNILFIDPVIYFETKDLKLGGELIFHFPFNYNK